MTLPSMATATTRPRPPAVATSSAATAVRRQDTRLTHSTLDSVPNIAPDMTADANSPTALWL